MRSTSKRFTSILASALMFIAAIFVYSNLVSPAYSEIKNLKAELLSSSKMVEEQQFITSQVQNLLNEYQDISSIENTVGIMLPLSQDATSNLNQITGLVTINNLKLESLSVSKMANRPSDSPNLVKGVGILRFTFQLSGSYENFKSFLKAVETNIALMDLVDLQIESPQNLKASGANLSFLINIKTYYQTE
ncbi:MAG: type 4a pilus biogenesis protein PilO [Spirochaetota bacterium]